MGSPANPISATTQKLEKGVSATADSAGEATFVFQSPPAGVSWTGTLNCANAPLASVFNAVIGGTSWGSWGGNSVFGPIQILGQGSEQLTVTATGLTAGIAYEVWFLGSSDQTVNLAPIWPDPTSSARLDCRHRRHAYYYLRRCLRSGSGFIFRDSNANFLRYWRLCIVHRRKF